jgi:hypothetical protein
VREELIDLCSDARATTTGDNLQLSLSPCCMLIKVTSVSVTPRDGTRARFRELNHLFLDE